MIQMHPYLASRLHSWHQVDVRPSSPETGENRSGPAVVHRRPAHGAVTCTRTCAAAATVHKEAHGLLADEIFQVQEGT